MFCDHAKNEKITRKISAYVVQEIKQQKFNKNLINFQQKKMVLHKVPKKVKHSHHQRNENMFFAFKDLLITCAIKMFLVDAKNNSLNANK